MLVYQRVYIYYFTVFWQLFSQLNYSNRSNINRSFCETNGFPGTAILCRAMPMVDVGILRRLDIWRDACRKFPENKFNKSQQINTIIHKHFGEQAAVFSTSCQAASAVDFWFLKFQEKKWMFEGATFHCSPYHLRHRHLWTRRTHHLWLQWVLVPLEMICLTQQTGEKTHLPEIGWIDTTNGFFYKGTYLLWTMGFLGICVKSPGGNGYWWMCKLA